ncbi:hypothetical protein Ddye_011885 [Dipteronia dyeriana]|uniref:RNase H type-1 domain-containing protein n=1 Tax=Dipteronia dyeriana TaxID=168575 RepID=A0AAE0CHS5_9ROSI|nr:hypothetical protein Ddye_011885 [Dipteronia dyeriana]
MLILLNIKDYCVDRRKSKFPRMEEWIQTLEDLLKFNVDGSARGNPCPASIGGVLKNHLGKTVCFFSEYIGFQDAITTEIRAIARGCEIIKARPDLAVKRIEIMSDSKIAVSWINNVGFGSITRVQTIYDIRKCLEDFGTITILFCARDFNMVADQLAKKV